MGYSYQVYKNNYPFINSYLQNPDEHKGKELYSTGKILEITKDYFIFDTGLKEIKITHNKNIKITLTKFGLTEILVTEKEGEFNLITHHNQNYNFSKYILSGIGFIIFLLIFSKEWKLTKRGFVKCRTG